MVHADCLLTLVCGDHLTPFGVLEDTLLNTMINTLKLPQIIMSEYETEVAKLFVLQWPWKCCEVIESSASVLVQLRSCTSYLIFLSSTGFKLSSLTSWGNTGLSICTNNHEFSLLNALNPMGLRVLGPKPVARPSDVVRCNSRPPYSFDYFVWAKECDDWPPLYKSVSEWWDGFVVLGDVIFQ